MSREITRAELHAHVRELARIGLWLGIPPVEVLAAALKRFELFTYDSAEWLEDIVAYEVLTFRCRCLA
jgi:hypothetical protein